MLPLRMLSVPIHTVGSLHFTTSQEKATTSFRHPAADLVVRLWEDLITFLSPTWHQSQSWGIKLTAFSSNQAWVSAGMMLRAPQLMTRQKVSIGLLMVCITTQA